MTAITVQVMGKGLNGRPPCGLGWRDGDACIPVPWSFVLPPFVRVYRSPCRQRRSSQPLTTTLPPVDWGLSFWSFKKKFFQMVQGVVFWFFLILLVLSNNRSGLLVQT